MKTKKVKAALTDAQLVAQELRVIRLELRNVVAVLMEIRCQMDPECGAEDGDDEGLM